MLRINKENEVGGGVVKCLNVHAVYQMVQISMQIQDKALSNIEYAALHFELNDGFACTCCYKLFEEVELNWNYINYCCLSSNSIKSDCKRK